MHTQSKACSQQNTLDDVGFNSRLIFRLGNGALYVEAVTSMELWGLKYVIMRLCGGW